jgi:SAM-dependent methyltransferase
MASTETPGHQSIDYERHGRGYARHRRPDPRIAARIHAALGDARTVVNVGAGSGSYEPEDRHVVAFEPSEVMRAERPRHLAPAISAPAEDLPLDSQSVDAALAILTVHHWDDPAAGLRELRRVTRGPVVVATFHVAALESYWMLADYLPEAIADDRRRFPDVTRIAELLGGARLESVPVPADCADGFFEAYWARPEAYLDEAVRSAQSIWPRLPPGAEQRAVRSLEADLTSGAWDSRHGRLRRQPAYDGLLMLVISQP